MRLKHSDMRLSEAYIAALRWTAVSAALSRLPLSGVGQRLLFVGARSSIYLVACSDRGVASGKGENQVGFTASSL